MTADGLRRYVRKLQGGGSDVCMARVIGVSPQYFSDVMRGRREPGPKFLGKMGLRRVVSYLKVKP